MTSLTRIGLLSILFALTGTVPGLSEAANRYVRSGATGSNNGTDWTNAYTTLPATLVRGDTYYIADGTYTGNQLFDDTESGTTPITIKKASVSDHGTDTGWISTYGDGQATFSGNLYLARDYYVFDGKTRNESDWTDTNSYGFRILGEVFSWPMNFPPGGDNLTFKYMAVGANDGVNPDSASGTEGFYFVGNGSPTVHDIVVSHCLIKNTGVHVRLETTNNITIEYTWMGTAWQKEVIRGSGGTNNTTIRYNVVKDGCQDVPSDSTANGCTAEFALWDGGTYNGTKIYGNIIWNTINIAHSNGCILVGGDGVFADGPAANNTEVYNNTFAGIRGSNCRINITGNGTGNIIRNNLWYDSSSATGCVAGTCSNNTQVTADPFVNYSAGNFHLRGATAAGASVAPPYNVDRDGVSRGGDGAWDLGAYEFGGTGTRLAAPTNLRIQ